MQIVMTPFVKKHPLVFIFVLAVVMRVLLLLIFPLPDQSGGDFTLYQRIADNILSQGNFGGEPQKTYGSPSITPGWAFFLAGYELFFGKSVAALVAASAVLGGLLAIGTYLLSSLFFERNTALIAGVATALWPVFLIQTFKYGSSLTLYSTVLVFSTYFFVKAARGERWLYAALSGALLGFAALVDAIAFFIPFVLLVWIFLVQHSWRTVWLSLIFLVAAGLVIAPWTYRNYVVSHTVTQKEVPIIAKDELKRIIPRELVRTAGLVSKDGALLSGLSKIYVFPHDISLLDQRSVETEAQRKAFSYKERLRTLVRGENIAFSGAEWAVLAAKIIFTLLHWLLIALAAVATALLWRRHERSLPMLVLLLAGYVTAAVIGFGSLAQDDFQSISAPNSFLVSLIPLLIILASFSLWRLARD